MYIPLRLFVTLPCLYLCCSNARLTNPTLTGASLTATDITLSGVTAGLAYFSTKGALSATPALALDAAGRLLLTDTHADLDAHGHEIRNVRIASANLTQLGVVQTAALYLSGTGTGDGGTPVQGGLLMTREGGRVVSAQGAISIDPETGTVTVKSLSAGALAGPLDAQQQVISNAVLQGGSAAQLSALSAEHVTVGALREGSKSASAAAASVNAAPQRLVFADAQGGLKAQQSAEDTVAIAQLSVRELHFQSDEVDFRGRTLKNVKLDGDSFVLGPQRRLQTDELVLTRVDASLSSGALLSASAEGKVGALSGVSYANGVLDVATSTVSAATVRTQSLTLTHSGTKSASFLTTDAEGAVVGSAELALDRMTARQGVTITAAAGVQLQGREAGTLLTVNDQGELVTVPKPVKTEKGAKTDAAQSGMPVVDAQLRDVTATTLAVDTLTAARATIEELHLSVSSEKDSSGSGGSMLVQSKVSH